MYKRQGQGRTADAEEAYTHAMALTGGEDRPPASLKLFLRLGAALLAEGKLDDARGVYLAACEMCPRASTWLGAAVAMLRDGDLEGAEAALAEANILDASNPKVWGHLCVVALLAERVDEAEAALGSAFKTDLRDARLLAEIGRLFLERGRWRHCLLYTSPSPRD